MKALSKVTFKNIVPKSKLTKQVQQGKSKKKKSTTIAGDAVTTRQKAEQDQKAVDAQQEDDIQVETISLEEFVLENKHSAVTMSGSEPTVQSELSLLDKILLNVTEKDEENCFKETVQLVYSPISSQLLFGQEIVNLEEYAYIGMRLGNTIRNAFPSSSCKFEQIWDELAARTFPDLYGDHKKRKWSKPIDNAILNLQLRKERIDRSATSKHYSSDNFNNEREYEKWRSAEKHYIEALIQKAQRDRVSPFTFRINIDCFQMCLDTNYSMPQRQEIYFKIRASEQPDILIVSPGTRTRRDKETRRIRAVLEEELPSIDCTVENQNLIINTYKRGVLGSERFGQVVIPLSDLLKYFVPNNSAWGIQPFSSEYFIYESTKGKPPTETKIGKLFISFNMQMSRSAHTVGTAIDRKVLDKKLKTDYHFLFDILVHQLIASNTIKERDGGRLLDFQQIWIIEEFCNQHGISEVYKRLSIMREMVQRSELLLPYIEEFKESIDFVNTNVKEKFVITTKYEIKLLNAIKEKLTEKLKAAIIKFISDLDKCKRKVLRILIELLEYISTGDDSMTKDEFATQLKQIISDSLRVNYDSIKFGLGEVDSKKSESDTTVLIKMVDEIRDKIYDIFYYSMSIPTYCKWETRSLRVYLEELTNDFEDLKRSNKFTGYSMLTFCSRLQDLNDEILDNYSKKELKKAKVKLLDPKELSKEYEVIYMKELKNTLMTQMKRAISLDNWQQCNEEVLHSVSVVDVFTSAFQTLEFMANAEFLKESILDRYCITVGECVLEYAKILQDLCIRDIVANAEVIASQQQQQTDIPSPRKKKNFLNFKFNPLPAKPDDESDEQHDIEEPVYVTTEFIVKLNNIEASRTQFKDWVKALMEEKCSFKEVDMALFDEDESNSDSDSGYEDDYEQKPSNEKKKKKSKTIDPSVRNMKRIISTLSVISTDLEVLIASLFKPYIKYSLANVLSIVRKDMKKSDVNLSHDEIIRNYGPRAARLLKDTFLESVVTPNLAVLSENIYESAFTNILAQLFGLILNDCISLLLPYSAFLKKRQDTLDNAQIALMKHMISVCENYFFGDGEGLSKSAIAREKRFITQILQLFEMDTPRLIGLYQKVNGLVDNRKCTVKGYHILAVLSTRPDRTASKFFAEHKQQALTLYLIQEFNLPEEDTSSNNCTILLTKNSINSQLKKGKYYLTQNYLLWRPKLSFMMKSRNRNSQFSQPRTAIEPLTGKFKIHLEDVLQIETVNTLTRKGIKLYVSNKEGAQPTTPVASLATSSSGSHGSNRRSSSSSSSSSNTGNNNNNNIMEISLYFYKKRRREKLLAALTQRCQTNCKAPAQIMEPKRRSRMTLRKFTTGSSSSK